MDVMIISQIKVTQALAMVAQLALAETEGHITCPNVVLNIFVLRDMIVQPRNPKALEVKFIKDSTTIIVLFDGLKSADVMCGASMLRYGGSGSAPKKYRRRRDMIRAMSERAESVLEGGAQPRQRAAAAGPVEAPAAMGAFARVSGSRRPPR
ncbi:hypothetical protein HPB52_008648 [Rhipicephalus sanguineus]|uniref:Uncharacterized protein n=1 Tax=Rhipicephalus sanguineus TaxID=34632 RepID=A0A9D4QII4_RHISA|nr:hypothetical protein HPB52_008648 [Rhipicephalus sanguineus]